VPTDLHKVDNANGFRMITFYPPSFFCVTRSPVFKRFWYEQRRW